jgi:diguanylate cyclase (GGDEF)-like protein/PAS domain S-box-containing protein
MELNMQELTVKNTAEKHTPVVLLIEDDPGDVELVRLQLLERKADAFVVIQAASLKEAAQKIRSEQLQPDVVLLDLNLPDSTGTQTVRLCRNLIPDVPVVVLTGLDDYQATQMAIEAGAEDFLTKGSEGSLLRKAIRYALLRHERDISERLALTVFQHAREGIMITDADAVILEVNEAFTRITGYTREEAVGQKPSLLSSGHHDTAFYEDFWQQLKEEGSWQGEVWNRRKSGEVFVESMTISGVRDAGGSIRQYVSLFTDITEQKAQQSQLEHLAHFDALTRLPNRVLFSYRLNQLMAYARRHNSSLAVAFLDLDGFKPVNDNHGHAAGDYLLQQLADRMSECLRDEDTLARFGGDEFALVLELQPDHPSLEKLLERLQQAIARPVIWESAELRVTASIGVTFFPQAQDVDTQELLDQADEAMYEAKNAGKNRYAFHPSCSQR